MDEKNIGVNSKVDRMPSMKTFNEVSGRVRQRIGPAGKSTGQGSGDESELAETLREL